MSITLSPPLYIVLQRDEPVRVPRPARVDQAQPRHTGAVTSALPSSSCQQGQHGVSGGVSPLPRSIWSSGRPAGPSQTPPHGAQVCHRRCQPDSQLPGICEILEEQI